MRPTVALLSAIMLAASSTLHAAPESDYLIGTGDIYTFDAANYTTKRQMV